MTRHFIFQNEIPKQVRFLDIHELTPNPSPALLILFFPCPVLLMLLSRSVDAVSTFQQGSFASQRAFPSSQTDLGNIKGAVVSEFETLRTDFPRENVRKRSFTDTRRKNFCCNLEAFSKRAINASRGRAFN